MAHEEEPQVGLDDIMSTESAFVAAATAAVLSPKTRETIRKGAVYGVAGALRVGDVVAGATRGVVRGVRGEESAVSDAADAGGTGTSSARGSSPASRSSSSGGSRSSGSSGGSRRASGSASTRRAAATTKSAGSAAGS